MQMSGSKLINQPNYCQVENDLDTTTEKLLKATLDIEQAEKDQLAKEEEVGPITIDFPMPHNCRNRGFR